MTSPAVFSDAERRHMRHALTLAQRGLGSVWPNPAVGCVVVDAGGRVAGRGWTQPGGRPHAETEALNRAGPRAAGATVFVTLEPCNHHGKTPPCTDAILAAGVARLVAPCEDPDPRVSGAGFRRLREAGVAVDAGLMAVEARDLNAGFFLRNRSGRPWVTLKLATTLDGRIATRTGVSRWITGPAARQRVHLLRAQHDGVMVGVGTALADDPALTCRLPGFAARQPVRIVLDSSSRADGNLAMLSDGAAPVWLVTAGHEPDPPTRGDVDVLAVDAGVDGRVDLAAALSVLGDRGLTRVLVEGGATVAASLMRAGLVDEIVWFRAGAVMGDDGLPAVAGTGVAMLREMQRYALHSVEAVGDDVMEVRRRNAPSLMAEGAGQAAAACL